MEFRPPHILLIEDDLEFRSQLAAALETKCYSVECAGSLRDGMSMVRSRPPRVVVCDVRLPDGDGRSLLRSMRSDPRLMMIQFVLMTGYHKETPQRAGMDLGADDYLAKPFSIADFLACIEARLKRTEYWAKALEQKTVDYLRGTVSSRLPHEIFTPLAGILGFCEILLEDLPEGPEGHLRESARHIHDCADRLHRTLRNYIFILQLMEPGSSVDKPRSSGFPLDVACADLETTARLVAERHNRSEELQFDCAVDADGEAIPVWSNELTKIAEELIDNAFKFSPPEQPVEVSLELEGTDLCLAVKDRGRGLSTEQVANIGAFRQFDRTRFEQQGLGLGLTIAQHLIERSQGSFAISSSAETGTRIAARWPLIESRSMATAE